MQGLLKHMKSSGKTEWTYEDYVDTFGDGSCNLSDTKLWGSREGKERLELALEDRLFDHQLSQQHVTSRGFPKRISENCIGKVEFINSKYS